MMQSVLFTFASTFSTLLLAGIPTAESLRLSYQSVGNLVAGLVGFVAMVVMSGFYSALNSIE